MIYQKIRYIIHRLRWIGHPVTIFVSLQIVWLAITLIWVIWFLSQQEAIAELARRFGQELFDSRVTLTILIVGCILLGVLCVGLIMLFVFGQKQSAVARQQRNFVSSVTHELKSPLASLQLSFESLISLKPDSTTTTTLHNMILGDIDRLKRLVDQILVAGRLDRGIPQNEEWQTINLSDFVGETIPRFTHLDPKLESRITFDFPHETRLKLPRSTLGLILGNLIENAIKYSKRDTQITIGAEGGNHEILLYVRDQGIGLDRKERRRIFKMFHRGQMVIKKSIPGTGLGLYIVKEAVKSLGGSIWVESPGLNFGATFYVSLPTRSESHD